MKISVVGCGAFATANTIFFGRAGHELTMIFNSKDLDDIRLFFHLNGGLTRENYRYLKGVEFPAGVRFSDSFASVVNADVVLLAEPAKYLWSASCQAKRFLTSRSAMVMISCHYWQRRTTSLLLIMMKVPIQAAWARIQGQELSRQNWSQRCMR